MSEKIKTTDFKVKTFLELLNNDNVITYSSRLGTNKYQLVKESDDLKVISFNCYGNKLKNKDKIIKKNDIKEYLLYCISSFSAPNYFSYHKKRISKKELKPHLNNEADSKKLVYKWLLDLNSSSVIIPEFSLGSRRCDYISFNSKTITIIEIKSELDSFARLTEQLKIYSFIAHNVYLAIHIKNYNKLIKKNIEIPKNTGILVIDNNEIKLVKDAKKNKIEYNSLEFYISYNEFKSSIKGLKGSSKATKDAAKDFLNHILCKDELYSYYLGILKSRYFEESDLRKKFFYNNDIDKSIASSSQLNINRFTLSSNNSFYLSDHLSDLDNLALNKFLENYNK